MFKVDWKSSLDRGMAYSLRQKTGANSHNQELSFCIPPPHFAFKFWPQNYYYLFCRSITLPEMINKPQFNTPHVKILSVQQLK